jgi:hypothetical protein
MKEIDLNKLDTAIAIGDAVCNELGICCEKRGRVIFQIYKKLGQLKPSVDPTVSPATDEAHTDTKHVSGQDLGETLEMHNAVNRQPTDGVLHDGFNTRASKGI